MKRTYNRPAAQPVSIATQEGILAVSTVTVNTGSDTTIDGTDAYSNEWAWGTDDEDWDTVD